MAGKRAVTVVIAGDATGAQAAFRKVEADSARMHGGLAKNMDSTAKKGNDLLYAGGLVVGLGLAVNAAADFQTQMTRLVTTAGESQANLGMVSKGVLNISAATGTSTKELATGMYLIESAGFHGAKGLQVLAASAEGAKIEGASLGEVTNAVSSLLVDYHLPASKAAEVTSQLIAAVGHGKTTFQEMAAAIPNVAAAANSAHVSLAEMSAAIATMTMHGTNASAAGTYLRQVIGQLEAPSAKARKAMESLGISANDVGLTLSSGSGHGLSDAIAMLEKGIKDHLAPSGLVAMDVFKKSGGTASDYQKMLANLPPTMITTFGALATMTGGVKSLQGFLQLGGENLATFRANTKAVAGASVEAGGHVEGWSIKQHTLNQQLDELKQAAHKIVIEVGTGLIPMLSSAATFTLAHEKAVFILGGTLLGLVATIKVVGAAQAAWIAGMALVESAVSAMETIYVGAMIAMDTAMGPIGLAILAITAVAAVATKGFGLFGGGAHAQVKPVAELTQAISDDGLAFGKLTEAQVANKLQAAGAYDAGMKLGVSQRTVTLAALGNVAAQKQVAAAVDKATVSYKNSGTMLKTTTSAAGVTTVSVVKMTQAQKDAEAAAKKLGGSVGTLTGQLGASRTAALNVAAGLGKIPKATHTTTFVMTDAATAKVKTLTGQINAIRQGHVPGVTADTAAGKARIKALQSQIDGLRGGNVVVGVQTVYTQKGQPGAVVYQGGQRIAGTIGQRASGGPVRKGLGYIVGEDHAEYFQPDQDGTIIPDVPAAHTGSGSASNGGGGAQTLTVNLVLDGHTIHKSLLRVRRLTGGGLGLA